MSATSPHTVEHLKMIQDVVTRMAGNSAHVKTWAVSLVTAAFVFSGLSDNPHWLIALGGIIPVLAFSALDARYLHLEKRFRELYKSVAKEETTEPFDMDTSQFTRKVGSTWKVAWSWSVWRFYSVLLAAVLVLLAILVLTGE